MSIGFDPAPSVVGDTVNVTGALGRVTPDGGWTGAPGQVVKIFFRPNGVPAETQVAQGVTAADGTYSVPVTVPGEGFWHAENTYAFMREPSSLGWGNGAFLGTRADSALVIANHRTTITGFNASPEPVGKGATITASGRVLRFGADGSTEPGTGSPFLQFSAARRRAPPGTSPTPSPPPRTALGARPTPGAPPTSP